MPAERRSFKDEIEPLIYWDATFTIAFFVLEDRFHDECVAFKNRLDEEGKVPAVSDFVYNELAFYLVRNALTAEARRRGQHWRNYALLPTDAYHIAIALDAGVNAFATVDADFLNVDGIIVYTCLSYWTLDKSAIRYRLFL